MLNHQIDAVKFLIKKANDWHSFNDDVVTGEVVDSLVHKGIAKSNEHNQFKLKCMVKANRFLLSHANP